MLDQPHQSVDLTLEPLDDFVVVQPSEGDAETRGGLIIPASAEMPCRSGIATAVGPDVVGVEPGDKVLYPRDAGYEVRMAGVSVRLIKREDLIARVHD
jgi:co-chaperonin GroES (HSP10)